MTFKSQVTSVTICAGALTLLGACASNPPPLAPPPPVGVTPAPPPAPVPAAPRYGALGRLRFNQLAVQLDLPLFWIGDKNHNHAVDADEVKTLLFYPSAGDWVEHGKLTPAFDKAYGQMVALDKAPPPAGSSEEAVRKRLVVQELDQGAPTLVYTNLTALSAPDKAFVRHILAATDVIDQLYAVQSGMAALESQVPKDDPASQSLMRRNWGPRCRAPKTEDNPHCSAIPGAPKPVVDVYPASIQADPDFCKKLEKNPAATRLLTPFTVVRDHDGKLEPVPYSKAYPTKMNAVAKELDAAAEAIGADPNETALKTYLIAAAQSFRTNDWGPADEAWSKMNARNSKWYVRVAPDETYWDPCSQKAGFHMTFARINRDSLKWQDKLSPLKEDMEHTLAKLIGPPYRPRKVTFHLPDFIDIVVNGGNDRDPFGATIGESLPNWGKVAREGRGRTVAMSNLYTDPDSRRVYRAEAASLLTADAMRNFPAGNTPSLLGTILHEATHNLGPAAGYRYRGKSSDQAFGGGMSAMLEELKAQTGSLFFLDYVANKSLVSQELRDQTYVDSIIWAFGHISRGMYTPTGQRRPYSQLSAIQIGFLMDQGAIAWDPNAKAANGQDTGAFVVHFDKLESAVVKLMKLVGTIKAKNDRAGAEALAKQYVDGNVVPQKVIAERFARFPKTSFVYALDL
jgi:hypothetical protein